MLNQLIRRDVAELSPAERQAVELFAGRPLANGQVVVLMIEPRDEHNDESRAAALREMQELFRKIDAQGTDEDSDPIEFEAAVDAAVEAERRRTP